MTERGFKVLKVDHLGIVPKDFEKALNFFRGILALKHIGHEHVSDQKVEVDILECAHDKSVVDFELLKASDEESPIQAFLTKRGGGIHHIALRVDNIDAALAYLQKCGVSLIDSQARAGAQHSRVAFVHPRATGGILVELVEKT